MKYRSSIDIGTHSVRLLVADFSKSKPESAAAEIEITRLGEGLDKTRRLNDSAVERSINVIKKFVEAAAEFGTYPYIFGTAALREAENGIEAADRILSETGIPVSIISPLEEALLTYSGASLIGLRNNCMVLDIGGGSTEFITAKPDSKIKVECCSQKLGSVRHTERCIKNNPPTAEELINLRNEIRIQVIEGIAGRKPEVLYGVAGSVTQLAALELKMERYEAAKINGVFLSAECVEKWISLLSSLTIDERKKVTGMVNGRAETVIAGSVILAETIAAVDLEGVYVSDYDSLWGAVLDFL